MLSRTVGLIAASALGAQALLLPPGVASVEGDLSPFAVDTNRQSIKLPCPECAFSSPKEMVGSEDGDDTFWIQGGADSVLLDFALTDDGHSMGIKGYTLYPPSVNMHKPEVDQVASSASLVEIKDSSAIRNQLRVSSDSIFVSEEAVSPAGDAVVRITYQLISVEGQPISVDGAKVTMLKGADGALMILNVEPVPKAHNIFDVLPHAEDDGKAKAPKECSNMVPAFMCKWKNVVESKVEDIKAGMPKMKGGCRGKKLPGHLRPHIKGGDKNEHRPEHETQGKRPHHGGPPKGMRPHHGPHGQNGTHGHPHNHHGHHGHHGHHRHHMRFLHQFAKGVAMILIPVMAGITMGMTVSLVGMLVGRLIAFLWIKFARGGQRGYASVAQEESDAEAGEKQIVLVEEETEPLPRYEDAPAYEEKELQ